MFIKILKCQIILDKFFLLNRHLKEDKGDSITDRKKNGIMFAECQHAS